jgi:hypothetical protein
MTLIFKNGILNNVFGREISRSPLLVQQSNYSFDRDQIICGAAHQAALKRGYRTIGYRKLWLHVMDSTETIGNCVARPRTPPPLTVFGFFKECGGWVNERIQSVGPC